MSEHYSSDKPVEIENQDRFQRYGFSKRIAETIIQRENEEGIVIGIYGAWGEGKTSVLNFIKSELDQNENILTLTLNPWRYNDEESLIKNFLNKVAEILGKELDTKKEKLGGFIEKYGTIGSIIGKDISEIGKNLSSVDLETLKNRIDEFLKESESKLVIFVDDIDRLDKQEIYSLFRLVKLTADFTNTTYVLSFDEKMVASAIGERFGKGNLDSGHNFLEKIIQVPLQIPQAQPDALKKYCFELVDNAINKSELELSKKEVQRFVSAFSHNILLRLKTPRLAIRYGNSLSFAIPLLKGEVNHVDLMLIEAIKVFYPKHYSFIKSSPHYFTSSYSSHSTYGGQPVNEKKEELKKHLDELAKDLTKTEKDAISQLLKTLFPRLNEAFHNTFQHEGHKEWLKEKRIVSTSYFKRYFSYAVIEGELSDVMFEEFMNSLETMAIDDIAKGMIEIVDKSSPDNFLFKARTYEETLSWKASQNLILSIAIMSDSFPKSDSFLSFGMGGAQAQAAIFIYNLLKNHKDNDAVFELSKTLMGKEIPYDFSYQINNWLRSGEGEEKIFKHEQYVELAKVLRERVLKECGDTPIFEKFPDNLFYIFSNWYEDDSEDLKKYLKRFIDKDAKYLKQLFVALTPTATSSNHPEPYKSNFDKEGYNYITNILDKEYLHDKIIEYFSDELMEEEVKFQRFDHNQSDINILRQFEHWYSKDDGIQEAEIVE
ncbi:P-loop NTPase fold protein [Dokdonia sp. Asnod2-E02]|uniref:KAP family P-loop NTPase fold protein n=1 Tax=Dokdonia sp. Asnod2-E02 TaxID=3160574 RepID=UPI00386B69E0